MAETSTKSNFDRFKKPDAVIPNGTHVVVQRPANSQGKPGKWDRYGTIVSKRPHTDIGQSYIVEIDGQEFVRSQLHLRPASDETVSVEGQLNGVASVENPDVVISNEESSVKPPMRTYAEVAASEEKTSTPSETRSQVPMRVPPRRSNRKNVQKPYHFHW